MASGLWPTSFYYIELGLCVQGMDNCEKTTHTNLGTGFVDDTDSVHNTHDPQLSTQEMIAETQAALKKWEGLVAATGGSLAPEKSSWCLVELR